MFCQFFLQLSYHCLTGPINGAKIGDGDMAKMALDQRSVDRLQFAGKREIYWDTNLAGFGVEVLARGRFYVTQTVINGKDARRRIGNCDDIKLADARSLAKESLGSARRGLDRLKRWDGEKKSFEKVALEWITQPRPDGKPRSQHTIKDYSDRCARILFPVIGGKTLSSITPADVRRLLSGLGDRDRDRSYALTIVKAVFNYAKSARYLQKSFDNPADEIKVERKVKEKRVLTAKELSRFWAALAEMEDEGSVSASLAGLLRVSVLLGLRPGEAKTLRWDDIDFKRKRAMVTGKVGRRSVPLSDDAIQAIKALMPEVGNPFVFIGRVSGGHIVGVHKMLGLICERAGVEYFTPYDLRHSAATNALASGADVRSVQALLGHADLATTAKYLHTSQERDRQAADLVARFITKK